VRAGCMRANRARHRVLHVHARVAVERRREQMDVADRHRAPAIADLHDLALLVLFQHDGLTSPTDPSLDELVVLLHREQDDAARTMPAHLGDERIIGVQDGGAVTRYRFHDDLFDGRELFERLYLAEPEVIPRYVQHNGDVVPTIAESLSKDPAAGDLEHGEIDPGVLQDLLRRSWAACVDLLREPVIDVDAVRRRHADLVTLPSHDVADHPDGRRLAVRAGHRDDRDPRRATRWEQEIDHGFRDVLRLAFRRVRVHPEPRRGVHLNDGAAGLAHRLVDVRREEVDAGYVEPDAASGLFGDVDVVVVRVPRAVDRAATGRHVARRGDPNDVALFRDVIEGSALLLQQTLDLLIDPHPSEDLLVPESAPRVGVHEIDELAHRV